jgi:hypothetical protein
MEGRVILFGEVASPPAVIDDRLLAALEESGACRDGVREARRWLNGRTLRLSEPVVDAAREAGLAVDFALHAWGCSGDGDGSGDGDSSGSGDGDGYGSGKERE